MKGGHQDMANKVNKLLTLAPEVLNNLIAARADQGAKQVVQQPAQGNKFLQTIGNIAETAGDFLPGIFGTAAKIIGKISKNHDDWFSGFTCSGVTPNEFLATKVEHNTDAHFPYYRYALVAAIAVNDEVLNFSDAVKDDQFPAILAYVRNKCDNVLIEDTQKYWEAFALSSYLTAVYYTCKKYMKLVKDYPLNIQQLEYPLRAASPKILSQLKGIIDSLGDYLTSTVRLPDAWNRYLHWRYGTAFMSDKTDRSGLILYDAGGLLDQDVVEQDYSITYSSYNAGTQGEDPDEFITELLAVISSAKNSLSLCGRAVADLKLAFNSALIKEVDDRHYDAKEFNLRCNANLASEAGFNPKMNNLNRIIIASELNMSAAIQGITTATCRSDRAAQSWGKLTVPFLMMNRRIYTQFQGTIPSLNDRCLLDGNWVVVEDQDCRLANYSSNTGTTSVGTCMGALIGAYKMVGANAVGNEALQVPAKDLNAALVYTLGSTSLQCHWANPQYIVQFATTQYVYESQPLAYDTAYITDDQLTTIQRTALRNLFRGEYKFSVAEEKKDAQEAIADVAKVVEKVD